MKRRVPMIPWRTGLVIAVSALLFLYACGTAPRYRGTAGRETAYEKAAPPPSPELQYQTGSPEPGDGKLEELNTEEYDRIYENPFLSALENPLSTFSIDVDTASYANVRRFLNNNQLPYPDAVRIEEMINYFSYSYPGPEDDAPFAVVSRLAACPWNEDHLLALIALQGKEVPIGDMPPANLVFLIDVSGSMNQPDKLPLLKSAFRLLVDQLREEDRVAIVVYAGAAGLVLPPTPGDRKQEILAAIDSLEAGGSTAGGEGLKLAYDVAGRSLVQGGNNRIILATDGDFNVGPSSNAAMIRMIEEHRDRGVFITVLGFGMGNLKDSKMEHIADKGNGNYAYIDSILEAKKVLVEELGGTLLTIAKDVKIQIEFNPALVKGYRLIGYENRVLAKEDFEDDAKDAGELGAGHTVTALYEIMPAGSDEELPGAGELKYQSTSVNQEAYRTREILTIKLRYKKPEGGSSMPLTTSLDAGDGSYRDMDQDFRFACAVAAFGMLLRESEHRGEADYRMVLDLVRDALGKDPSGFKEPRGYRHEFLRLVEKAMLLDRR